jgi:hypothetical protein
MSRWRSSIAGPLTFVAGTSKTILRANPRRCRIILPLPPGTTLEFSYQEVTIAGQGIAISGATYPLVISEEDWGDLVERAISGIMSNAITINVIEVLDTERKI